MIMIVGLDVGEKRIGVAKTDELGLLAHSVGVIERKSDKQAVAKIRELVLEWKAEKLVVGLPKDMSGKIGKSAEKVMAFAEKIKADLPEIELEFWDERLTTKGTERMLIESADMNRERRREVIDKLAAQAILQNYLEAYKKRFPAC